MTSSPRGVTEVNASVGRPQKSQSGRPARSASRHQAHVSTRRSGSPGPQQDPSSSVHVAHPVTPASAPSGGALKRKSGTQCRCLPGPPRKNPSSAREKIGAETDEETTKGVHSLYLGDGTAILHGQFRPDHAPRYLSSSRTDARGPPRQTWAHWAGFGPPGGFARDER